MPQLIPLRGLRYTAEAGPMDELLAPPYDVISPAQQQALANRNSHNAVHLELAEGGEERYGRVAELIKGWEERGAVKRDDVPMLYVYEQSFVEEGKSYTRRALIAGVESQPWDEGAVKPHEFTMSGPKEDRMKLLQATKVQFSPVFMIARDRAGQLRDFLEMTIRERAADVEATTPDGDAHRMWVVEAGSFEMRRLAPLLSESFYIADGHHRYETAVNYKKGVLDSGTKLERDHPARFAMTAVVAADDPGLVIRPIHRVVPRKAPANWQETVSAVFEVEAIGSTAEMDKATAALAANPQSMIAIGLEPGKVHLLRMKDREALAARTPNGHTAEWAAISPNILRYGVLEPLWGIDDDALRAGAVEYSHDHDEIMERAAEADTVCFMLNPVPMSEVMLLADQGERMPQKSTFFHPKLGTGLVFNPLYP
jgi:uncharacterized protein (DUF1015 family)